MLAVGVAMVLGVLEWRVVKANVGARWNGYGAIVGVLRRDSDAPMRYRVLVPWLMRVCRCRSVVVYQMIKTMLLACALVVGERLLGVGGMLMLAVLVATTFEFDYWDCYAELLGVGCVLLAGETGDWRLAVAGGVVWGLSKETAVVAPGLGLLAGGWWFGLAGLSGPVVMGLVRIVQGRADLYCERWTWRAYNLRDLRLARERWDVGPWCSILWTVVTVGAMIVEGRVTTGVMERTAGMAGVWLVAGWLMARARETRVFLPCALWMAAEMGGRG